MKRRIKHLQALLDELMHAKSIPVRKEDVRVLPRTWGVYCIQKARSKKTLYIGTSESLHRRIYTNLLTKSGQHILKTKLRRSHGWGYSHIKRYLESCKIQWITCDRDESLALEHFAIAVMKSEMND